jgi:hypothetical protein
LDVGTVARLSTGVLSDYPGLAVEFPGVVVFLFSFEEPELPLPFGERVTFFAGAKKVTKETPFRI